MPSQTSPPEPVPSVRLIEIHGAPVDHGGAGPGAAGGPAALRAAGITAIGGRQVHDLGDVEVAGNVAKAALLKARARALCVATRPALQ